MFIMGIIPYITVKKNMHISMNSRSGKMEVHTLLQGSVGLFEDRL